jgi:hypothetical protein
VIELANQVLYEGATQELMKIDPGAATEVGAR